ncbi:ferrous iron transport protein B [Clostridium sp. 19966]|uniref:ferrous iron transport protein B n=1 Tax=Clostridium sp. 19966 TaxID=2768166 RepID=UPI0028DF4F7B|nr:ferrous iron transport protein B [Clostridium sp. 19966]MDT8716336.1 ferrous iron transport protein B [Clostridium sp. 19966]
MITVALIGNPNVGKSTLFNSLTGSNQYVGNWAGVTVEKKEGFLNNDIKIVDLPGIYAMDTYSNEEKVSKQFLTDEKVDIILNIIDASNLSRNLYLTMQLKEFHIPMILLVNMIDTAEAKGMVINYEELEAKFNIKVLPIAASKNVGIDTLLNALSNKNFLPQIDNNDYHLQSEDDIYNFIESNLNYILVNKNKSRITVTEKLDKLFLNKFLAYPLFIFCLFFIFEITFSWIGQPLADLLDSLLNDKLIPFLTNALSGSSNWFSSLIINGVISGVGSIIVFLPIILVLFLCISFLEDSGYMARGAFIMDKLMRKMGLSGKAFIPLIIGFGCSVPAIMSARTLESEKDRKLTALIVPLMSCNARLPVYALFASVFFPKRQALIIGSLYLLGVVMAFIISIIFKNTLLKKDEEPFLMELPEYKLPELRNLMIHTWDKGKGFLRKAGTIIFSISVLIWILSNFNFHGLTNMNSSFLASIGRFITPIFTPLGFSSWQASVSLISGIMAKEVVIGTMGVIYGSNLSTILPNTFTAISAYSFLVFVLLYTPCVSAMATLKKEYGYKWMCISIAYQLSLAWLVSFLVYNILTVIF